MIARALTYTFDPAKTPEVAAHAFAQRTGCLLRFDRSFTRPVLARATTDERGF